MVGSGQDKARTRLGPGKNQDLDQELDNNDCGHEDFLTSTPSDKGSPSVTQGVGSVMLQVTRPPVLPYISLLHTNTGTHTLDSESTSLFYELELIPQIMYLSRYVQKYFSGLRFVLVAPAFYNKTNEAVGYQEHPIHLDSFPSAR